MKKNKGNKGLLDKSRFEGLRREKERWLRNLTMKEAIHITEKMLSSPLVDELRCNSPEHRPICLKKSLERMRRNAIRRQRRNSSKTGANR